MVLARDDDQSSCDSSSSNSTSEMCIRDSNVQTRLIDSFSWHGACQSKPGRAIKMAFDLLMLPEEISHVIIDSFDNHISSVSFMIHYLFVRG